MAGIDFTSKSVPISDKLLNGGLNTTGGALSLQNNESSELQNIDFNKFGSIIKRNGFTSLTSTGISAADIDGLFMFETNNSGSTVASLVAVGATNISKMDALDGNWDNLTSGISITAGNPVDFATLQNILFMTNGQDNPFNWDATRNGKVSVGEVVDAISLTKAKYVEEFNNYLFYGNVTVSGTNHPSRIHWSELKDTETWTATDFIDVAQNDGQEITGLKVLSDRMVIFKTRSIYNLLSGALAYGVILLLACLACRPHSKLFRFSRFTGNRRGKIVLIASLFVTVLALGGATVLFSVLMARTMTPDDMGRLAHVSAYVRLILRILLPVVLMVLLIRLRSSNVRAVPE